MLARIHSAATLGLDARVLDVEVDVVGRRPPLHDRGPARHRRPRSARARPLRAQELRLPASGRRRHRQPRPGRLPQVGRRARPSRRDRPRLRSQGLSPRRDTRRVFVGELGLDGEVRPVRGALCLALAARDAGFDEIVLPGGQRGGGRRGRRDPRHSRRAPLGRDRARRAARSPSPPACAPAPAGARAARPGLLRDPRTGDRAPRARRSPPPAATTSS